MISSIILFRNRFPTDCHALGRVSLPTFHTKRCKDRFKHFPTSEEKRVSNEYNFKHMAPDQARNPPALAHL